MDFLGSFTRSIVCASVYLGAAALFSRAMISIQYLCVSYV